MLGIMDILFAMALGLKALFLGLYITLMLFIYVVSKSIFDMLEISLSLSAIIVVESIFFFAKIICRAESFSRYCG